MTVAIAVKVFDGIVLATDSATTLMLRNGSAQVWNNANKIFQLHRRRPVAAMTWGLGNVGAASIATLAKDLRRRLMGQDPAYQEWELGSAFTIEEVANRLVEFVYDEVYATEYPSAPTPMPIQPLGFFVAGYSEDESQSEAWQVVIEGPGQRPKPQLTISTEHVGWLAFAQPEATERLFLGYDPAILSQLETILDAADLSEVQQILAQFQRTPVAPSMPFADAISLARYLVDVTVGYSRVLLGPDTVGGPVEVAGITRHEGFKWISRKHYYSPELNPEDPHHDR